MNATILVINSDPAQSLTYSAGLRHYGYTVFEALNIHEAFDLILQNVIPNVIVMDLQPHTGDPLELSRVIRMEMQYRNMALVMIGNTPADERKALSASADAYLPRPVNAHNLHHVFTHGL